MKKKHEKKENFVTRDDIYNNKRIHVYKILLWIQAGRQPTSHDPRCSIRLFTARPSFKNILYVA